MKKIITLYILLVFGFSNAQYILWEDEFDGVSQTIPWSFYSLDNNPYTWNLDKNWTWGTDSYVNGSFDILNYKPYGRNDVFNVSPPQDDWAVSPMIDLTGASGTITLGVSFQNDENVQSNSLPIYISTTPDVQVIKDSNPFGTVSFNKPAFAIQFTEQTLDISSFAGQKIYIAFGKKTASGGGFSSASEIDYVTIVSDTPLATSDIKGKSANVTVYPNPVIDMLYIKEVTKANVAVYNATGQKVLSKAVTNGQLNVSALQKGVYTITIDANGKPSTTKFIKK